MYFKRVWDEIIIIEVLLETQIHVGDPHISIRACRFSLETPYFRCRPPDFSRDPKVHVGDHHIFIGHPQFIRRDPIFSLETPKFSM